MIELLDTSWEMVMTRQIYHRKKFWLRERERESVNKRLIRLSPNFIAALLDNILQRMVS
jgi:hypothetical protein